ncbi:PBS lyase HEAT-like repeat protein [Rivularia sp. PCC 7116]|uniref:HEAT repeat domain-containing protein n=1 Tax=Rivularia sp. PCC 7116 TaxID=373994 RepID=UPI00029ED50E|nr:HEAT repeat domain-containing protein [Rivularia sp. PCC 7116]AFY56024.1 PBS lyase HEAT-like repeat protein [Rivularia sp. PCC 7116]
MKSHYSNFWLRFAKIISYRFASTTSLTLLCFSPLIINITTASAQISENAVVQKTGTVSIKDIVSTLIQVLRSEDMEARVNAARALGGMGTQAKIAEPALMVALNDSESKVRYTAATALANIGGDTQSALPALQEALQNESKWIRNDAASALSNVALNMQTQSRGLETKELNQAIKDLEKTLEVMGNSDYEISPQVVKSINNSLDYLKRERLRG